MRSNPGIRVQGNYNLAAAKMPKILCVRADRLGDMLISTPLFRALRARWPKAHIDVLASPGGAAALKYNPHLNQILVYDKKRLASLPGLWAKLFFGGYDVVLNLVPMSKTGAMLCSWARGKSRYTLLEQPPNQLDLPVRQAVENPSHMSVAMLEMAWLMGCNDLNPCMEYFTPEDARNAMARLWHPNGLVRLGIFVGNIRKTNARWPVEKFVELCAALLKDENLEIVLFAGPEDEPLLAAFPENNSRLRRHVGREGLERTAALMESCRVFVTSSSGPQHLAAALGVPCVSIMHQENNLHWSPMGGQHLAVVSASETDARPVAVDHVLAAVRQSLAKSAC